jgi:pimeloyl-ACP methyl ester carboxylesterase
MKNNRVPLMLHLIRAWFGVLGNIAPVAAGRLAARMFLRPRRHDVPRRELQWLEGASRRDFHVEGHTIATYWWGEGPVVLCIHGWEGRGSQMGAFVAPLVKTGYTVVAMDLPAHGNSSGDTTDGYTCGRVTRAVCKEIGDIHGAVAHSFGGTAVLLAMSEGIEIKRVVLISPGINGDTFFSGFATIVGLPARATNELRKIILFQFGDRDWSIFSADSFGKVLDARSQAALVVHDDGDTEVPIAESAELVEKSTHARLLTTTGAGHRRILRNSEVIQKVVSFISGD